jgi:hypothetical protein
MTAALVQSPKNIYQLAAVEKVFIRNSGTITRVTTICTVEYEAT